MPPVLRKLRWLPVILMTGTLCAVASVPGSSLPQFLHNGWDKTAHTIAYGLLAASYLYGFGALGRKFPYRIAPATALICLTYAACEEWYQQFVPGRVSDRYDLRADSIGFAIVICLWLAFTLIRNKRREQ
jgi:VanZ family protein